LGGAALLTRALYGGILYAIARLDDCNEPRKNVVDIFRRMPVWVNGYQDSRWRPDWCNFTP